MNQIKNTLSTFSSNEKTFRRLLILILIYLIPTVSAIKPVVDPDIWWHLRTGQWIIENGTVPKADSFSAYGMGKPWIAYGWLFEALVYLLYRAFGLFGTLFYTTALSLLIALAFYGFVSRLHPHFPIAASISAFGLGAMVPLMNPRPWLFSVLFFIIELDILFRVRRSGNSKPLLLLPPLFALWANLHILFIYGLFALVIAALEPLVDRSLRLIKLDIGARIAPSRHLFVATLASIAATLVTPYHVHLYGTILELARDSGPYQYISELAPLQFRSPADWLLLVVVVVAVFLLGYCRELRPFPLLLLAAGLFLSFRSRRDGWFVVIAAGGIIAATLGIDEHEDRFAMTKLRGLIVTLGVFVGLFVLATVRNISKSELESAVARNYPVEAARFVETYSYPGPLYNHYNWGGYLIWRLPNLPVAMDGRHNVHGNRRIERSLKTWRGERDWASDPELTQAGLIIADVNHALSSLLRRDSRFDLVYEDPVAAVFVARP